MGAMFWHDVRVVVLGGVFFLGTCVLIGFDPARRRKFWGPALLLVFGVGGADAWMQLRAPEREMRTAPARVPGYVEVRGVVVSGAYLGDAVPPGTRSPSIKLSLRAMRGTGIREWRRIHGVILVRCGENLPACRLLHLIIATQHGLLDIRRHLGDQNTLHQLSGNPVQGVG
jgi:hypothetical protein